MLKREEWLHLARKLDWNYSYVSEKQVFPEEVSGCPWLPHAEWQAWDEPYRTAEFAAVVGDLLAPGGRIDGGAGATSIASMRAPIDDLLGEEWASLGLMARVRREGRS